MITVLFPFSRFPLLDSTGDSSPVQTLNFQADSGGTTTYSVYSSMSTTSDKFDISPDGNLLVLSKLLLGVDPPQYSLYIQAQDSFTGLSTKVDVSVMKEFINLSIFVCCELPNIYVDRNIATRGQGVFLFYFFKEMCILLVIIKRNNKHANTNQLVLSTNLCAWCTV